MQLEVEVLSSVPASAAELEVLVHCFCKATQRLVRNMTGPF